MDKIDPLVSHTSCGLGILNGSGQIIYSNMILDQPSNTAQPSSADSSSSTVGKSSMLSRQFDIAYTTEEQRKRGTTNARSTADSDLLSKRVRRRSQSSSPAPQDIGPSTKHNHPNRVGIWRSNEQLPSKQSPSSETGAFPASNHFSGETSCQQEQQTIDPAAGSAPNGSNTQRSRGKASTKQLHCDSNVNRQQINTFGTSSALYTQRAPLSTKSYDLLYSTAFRR
ncbi:hypothetical protein CDL15_Pgr024728 [Punica granatum]|uniref:Uncharacterized protein n=1 Tax=Punica granatum TaxID=22663 RepID=A0A218W527_PUNGR|nr:hypothetical protein CDL15_Pgr024728 [Punica granatum]